MRSLPDRQVMFRVFETTLHVTPGTDCEPTCLLSLAATSAYQSPLSSSFQKMTGVWMSLHPEV